MSLSGSQDPDHRTSRLLATREPEAHFGANHTMSDTTEDHAQTAATTEPSATEPTTSPPEAEAGTEAPPKEPEPPKPDPRGKAIRDLAHENRVKSRQLEAIKAQVVISRYTTSRYQRIHNMMRQVAFALLLVLAAGGSARSQNTHTYFS